MVQDQRVRRRATVALPSGESGHGEGDAEGQGKASAAYRAVKSAATKGVAPLVAPSRPGLGLLVIVGFVLLSQLIMEGW